MSANLVSGGAAWQELDATLGGTARTLDLRRVRAGVYTFTGHRLGPVAGSLVADGVGGFAITLGDTTGTGRLLLVGSSALIR